MKKTKGIKDLFYHLTFVAAILLIASCDDSHKPEDTKAVAEKHNKANFSDKNKKSDAQFLVNAAENNLKEISLGQLAQKNGNATHVKELGKKMEDAHTKSQEELSSLAKSKGVTIPTTPTDEAKDTYSKLDEKSSDEFDKAYAYKMVEDHKEAIDLFENASKDSNDAEIKSWANNTLPEMHNHLDHSIKCQKKCKSNKRT